MLETCSKLPLQPSTKLQRPRQRLDRWGSPGRIEHPPGLQLPKGLPPPPAICACKPGRAVVNHTTNSELTKEATDAVVVPPTCSNSPPVDELRRALAAAPSRAVALRP